MAKKFTDIKAPKTQTAPSAEKLIRQARDKKKETKKILPEPFIVHESIRQAKDEPPLKVQDRQAVSEVEKIDRLFEKFERQKIKRFDEEDLAKKQLQNKRIGFVRRAAVFMLLFLALSAVLFFVTVEFFSRATITFEMEKFRLEYKDGVIASAAAGEVDFIKKIIPAEIFSTEKNETLAFKASGEKYVERKAKGTIKVYNAHSSSEQRLVANTRFIAPDGKIFRLDSAISVPGAKIERGSIVPSFIEANITADKPGEAYNIMGAARFTIPGFSGTPRFDGFYGLSDKPIAGGFAGRTAFPTDKDITRARAETTKKLQENTRAFLMSQIPKEFKVLAPAISFSVSRTNVNTEVNANGEFTVTASGALSALGFRESDVNLLMAKIASSDLKEKRKIDADLSLKSGALNYNGATADFAKKQIAFNIDFNGIFWQPADAASVTQTILGKKESEVRAVFYEAPLMKKMKIEFWPRIVKTVPRDVSRVRVVIE